MRHVTTRTTPPITHETQRMTIAMIGPFDIPSLSTLLSLSLDVLAGVRYCFLVLHFPLTKVERPVD